MPSFPNRESWLAAVAPIAVEMENLFDFPANVLIAHWATECGWGTKVIGQHNYCGMKWRPRHGTHKVDVMTHEWITLAEAARRRAGGRRLDLTGQSKGNLYEYQMIDTFADFDSMEACARDFVDLLRGGIYAPAWVAYKASNDWRQYVGDYMKLYATANKAALVIQIAEQSNVILAINASDLPDSIDFGVPAKLET